MRNCVLCNKRISVFMCRITKSLICNYCCDKFQLNQWTEGWDKYFKDNHYNEKEQLNLRCLNCSGLCRTEGYEVNTKPEKGFGFSFLSFEHNGQFVFTDNPNNIYIKRKALLESIECTTLEDYFYLAETYHHLGEYTKSINLLTEVVEKFESYELYRLIAKSYNFNGDKELALRYFKKSLNLCESSPETNRYMAELLRSMKDYEGSIYYYKQSLDLLDCDEDGMINDIFNDYNYFGLAIAYSKLNQYGKAIEVADKFLARIDWEDFKERINEVRAGLVHDYNAESDISTTSTLYEILSLAYIELDDLDTSEEYINRAKWLNPKDTDIARLEGIIIGKRSSEGKLQEYKDLIEILKGNAEIKLFDSLEKMTESIESIKKNIDDIKEGSKVDLLELKPNFMGVGLNINEVIKRLSKNE